MDSFTPYPNSDPSYIDYGTVRIVKRSRSKLEISGNFTIFRNLGRELQVVLDYGFVRNGLFVPMVREKNDFCDSCAKHEWLTGDLSEKSNIPAAAVCPFPKGRYYIDRYEVSVSQLPPMLPPGQLYLRFMNTLDARIIAGFTLVLTLEP